MYRLEAPGEDTPSDWASLYRARGGEIPPHRPIFTGDIFVGLSVPGEIEPTDVIVLQHPCAIRADGVNLTPRLLVAEVRPWEKVPPPAWETRHYKLMPLVDLRPGTEPPHYAAFFIDLHVVPRENFDLERRYACLTQKGVNLLMQRWAHHNTRAVVDTPRFQEVTAAQYEEADMIEEWCLDREDDGIGPPDAQREIDAWLSESVVGSQRRRELLADPQQRSALRKAQRQFLREVRLRVEPE